MTAQLQWLSGGNWLPEKPRRRSILKPTHFALTPPLEALLARRPTNVVMVAMANKTARVVWAMLSRGEAYEPNRRAAA